MRYYHGFKYFEDQRGYCTGVKRLVILPSSCQTLPKNGKECRAIIDTFWTHLNEWMEIHGGEFEFSTNSNLPDLVPSEEATPVTTETVPQTEVKAMKYRSKKAPRLYRSIEL